LKYKRLEKVFKQARDDKGSVNLDGKGYETSILLGVKITKDNYSGEIKIYDPSKSVNYYIEIDENAYPLFYKKGWRKAVVEMTLNKYKEKLERVRRAIGKEMNSSRSPKRLRMLKESREQILKKYYKLTQKLN